MLVYKYKLYAPAKNLIIPMQKLYIQEVDKPLIINNNSPAKLRDGGAAILKAQNKNHQITKDEKIFIKPLFIKRPRECTDSYLTLAKANKAGEHNPWESITKKAPNQPITDPLNRPTTNKPI